MLRAHDLNVLGTYTCSTYVHSCTSCPVSQFVAISQSVFTRSVPKVGVRCENDIRKQYNRVWLEPVQRIVEHNGQVVTKLLDIAELRKANQVKVKWGSKFESICYLE